MTNARALFVPIVFLYELTYPVFRLSPGYRPCNDKPECRVFVMPLRDYRLHRGSLVFSVSPAWQNLR